MKSVAYFDTVYEDKTSVTLFDNLSQMFPDSVSGVNGRMIKLRVDTTDPRYEAAQHVLSSGGFHRVSRELQRELDLSREYQVVIHRTYDFADWESSELLELVLRTTLRITALRRTMSGAKGRHPVTVSIRTMITLVRLGFILNL